VSRRRRRVPLQESSAVLVTDPDLVALWPTKAPEGRAMLETLQRARDRARSSVGTIRPPSPNSDLYNDLDKLED
jgi:hypothetical protein